jgi:hypothetical protein
LTSVDALRVRIYLDDGREPLVDQVPPANVQLDTERLADGPHRLTVRACDASGRDGYEEIPFKVQNGPGVVVSGLTPHTTRRGTVDLSIDAFSAEDPFDPRYAEARTSIPVWVWIMILFVVAWAVWYAARMWDVPPAYAKTPTYATAPATASSTAPDATSH